MKFADRVWVLMMGYILVTSIAAAEALYERGEQVVTRIPVDLKFKGDMRRKAAANETLTVLKSEAGETSLYVAEEDGEQGLIALVVPTAAVRPAPLTLKLRMEEIRREVKAGKLENALKNVASLSAVDSLDPVLGKIQTVLRSAVESAKNLRLREAAMAAVEKEADRLERNAKIAGRANALDKGSYDYRRSSYGYYYYWDGYGYTRRYRASLPPASAPTPSEASEERKQLAASMRSDAETIQAAGQQGVAEARSELDAHLEGFAQLADSYLARIEGPAVAASAVESGR